MKTFKYTLSIIALLSFTTIFISCSDDDSNSNQQSITDEEITEVLKSSLVDAGGIVLDIDYMSTTLASISAGRPAVANSTFSSDLNLSNCNQTVSQTNSNSNTVGTRSWTITSNWSWTLNCDAQNNSISFDLAGNGTLDFDGPNLSKDITRTHNFNISGIEPASSQWIYNANHTRNGFIQSNVGNQNSMTTVLDYGSTDIVVSKTTQQIVSGTFNISFQATLPNNNIITRGATVVFNGNQTATVTLDNGTTFDISW